MRPAPPVITDRAPKGERDVELEQFRRQLMPIGPSRKLSRTVIPASPRLRDPVADPSMSSERRTSLAPAANVAKISSTEASNENEWN